MKFFAALCFVSLSISVAPSAFGFEMETENAPEVIHNNDIPGIYDNLTEVGNKADECRNAAKTNYDTCTDICSSIQSWSPISFIAYLQREECRYDCLATYSAELSTCKENYEISREYWESQLPLVD